MLQNIDKRNLGVNFSDTGKADVRVWAPFAQRVTLIEEAGKFEVPLSKSELGYWEGTSGDIEPGTGYKIQLDGKDSFPDPASLFQPNGVHGPSVAMDLTKFSWTDQQWKNIPQDELIIYELHTGCFSPDRNFAGIEKKLDYLVDLGVNAIEIMPVSQFPGDRNWGYDGVYPFAVQDSYGGPMELQRLVNACHAKGVAVILDVVFNHLGPEGNYLSQFGPYFTDKYRTPWGQALNFDDAWCHGARDYFTENALMWFRDFHIDALRMDAVHAIRDLSPTHLIKDIRLQTNKLMEMTGRSHYLIAELDLNDPVFINPPDRCGYGVDAQWVDEFHHALRVSAGQKREGYYHDFTGIAHLAKAYTDAYVYDGQYSDHRNKFFGLKTDNPGKQFVVFSQNHDQTGNRMLGERTSTLVGFEMCKLMAGAVMISPYLPMLFMGEEWAETNPFLFFISHTDKELAALVNKGRREEFSSFDWQGKPPDPSKEDTFLQSMLQWELLKKEEHYRMYQYYKMLIRLRKTQPALRNTDRRSVTTALYEPAGVLVVSRQSSQQRMYCLMNFSNIEQEVSLGNAVTEQVHKLADSADPRWGGRKSSAQVLATDQPVTIQPASILIYEQT